MYCAHQNVTTQLHLRRQRFWQLEISEDQRCVSIQYWQVVSLQVLSQFSDYLSPGWEFLKSIGKTQSSEKHNLSSWSIIYCGQGPWDSSALLFFSSHKRRPLWWRLWGEVNQPILPKSVLVIWRKASSLLASFCDELACIHWNSSALFLPFRDCIAYAPCTLSNPWAVDAMNWECCGPDCWQHLSTGKGQCSAQKTPGSQWQIHKRGSCAYHWWSSGTSRCCYWHWCMHRMGPLSKMEPSASGDCREWSR